MSPGFGVPGWLPLPLLVVSVPCFCLNFSLRGYSMCDPMWSIITIRFFCYVKFLGHCIFCLSLAVDCYWIPSPCLALIPALAKAPAPSPPSLALSRPQPETHTFVHSVSHSANSCWNNMFLSKCYMWGSGLGCHWRGWALAGASSGHTFSVTCVADMDWGAMIKICMQVSEGRAIHLK